MKVQQFFFFILITLSVSACGQPTNRPAPQPEYSLSGTVYAPLGQDIAGTAVVACYVVNDACDEARTVVVEVEGSGSSSPFNLTELEDLAYDLYAVKDVNGDEDYFGEGDFYGEVSGQVTPPKSGLELLMAVNGDSGTPDEPDQPGPGLGEPEPYVVKGRVTNSQGQPMAGVEVFADNTAYYNMNVFGVSDADGYYRIELGDVTPSSWQVGAYIERDYEGERLQFSLHVENDTVFAGVDGAIRNLEWRLSGETPDGGYYGAFAYVYTYEVDIDDYDASNFELTFTPDGPLVDGTTGETLVRRADGLYVFDIPVGHYTVTARYAPPGGTPVPLLIRMRDDGEYKTSTPLTFEDDALHGLMAELELATP